MVAQLWRTNQMYDATNWQQLSVKQGTTGQANVETTRSSIASGF